MFQGKGTVLKRCVEIGLGQVPGIAGLRKKAKIGDPIFPDRLGAGPQSDCFRPLSGVGMDNHQDRQNEIQRKV